MVTGVVPAGAGVVGAPEGVPSGASSDPTMPTGMTPAAGIASLTAVASASRSMPSRTASAKSGLAVQALTSGSRCSRRKAVVEDRAAMTETAAWPEPAAPVAASAMRSACAGERSSTTSAAPEVMSVTCRSGSVSRRTTSGKAGCAPAHVGLTVRRTSSSSAPERT